MQNVENQQKIIDNFVQNLVDLRKNTSNEKDNQKTIQKNCISNQGNGGDSTESYGDSFYSKNQGGSWSKLITKQELRKLARNPTENLVSIYLKGLILENKVSRLMIYEKEGAIPTKKPREELRNDQKNISII
ncbi:hypothetical protein M0811_03234 [Anaeramoeba ignava]|uniref:Uncharacterized protein n=1 Tax=Anaeramoeba ignava TaxID=1746090 RepID=A0A9Q0L8W0_ANAIG|nr:hypothetical protein M0811_03234 [Anaeramoeba ignava]